MALQEAAAWLDGDLVLPVGGKKYRVPEYSAEVGMRVEVILNAGRAIIGDSALPGRQQQILDDEAERDLYRDILGPAYEDLFASVSWPMLKLCAITAMFHFNVSPEYAEQHWNAATGKAPAAAANRASRRATPRTTAAASSTRSRASGSGTRPRRSS